MKEQERCRGVEVSFSSPFVDGEAAVNGCSASSSDKKERNEQIHSKSTVTSIGSKPGEDTQGMLSS